MAAVGPSAVAFPCTRQPVRLSVLSEECLCYDAACALRCVHALAGLNCRGRVIDSRMR